MARIRVLSEAKDLLRCRSRKSKERSQFKIAELEHSGQSIQTLESVKSWFTSLVSLSTCLCYFGVNLHDLSRLSFLISKTMIILVLFFLAKTCSMWDPSSPTTSIYANYFNSAAIEGKDLILLSKFVSSFTHLYIILFQG